MVVDTALSVDKVKMSELKMVLQINPSVLEDSSGFKEVLIISL